MSTIPAIRDTRSLKRIVAVDVAEGTFASEDLEPAVVTRAVRDGGFGHQRECTTLTHYACADDVAVLAHGLMAHHKPHQATVQFRRTDAASLFFLACGERRSPGSDFCEAANDQNSQC